MNLIFNRGRLRTAMLRECHGFELDALHGVHGGIEGRNY